MKKKKQKCKKEWRKFTPPAYSNSFIMFIIKTTNSNSNIKIVLMESLNHDSSR